MSNFFHRHQRVKIVMSSAPSVKKGASIQTHRRKTGMLLGGLQALGGGLSVGILLCVASCSRQPVLQSPATLSSETVALVGDQVISRAAFQQQLYRRGFTAATRDQIAAALDEMVRVEAIYAKARVAGFETNAGVQAAIKRLVAAQYEEELLKSSPTTPRASGEEISQYYQTHQAEFTTPERVRAAVIFLKVPAKATPEKQAEHALAAAAILGEAQQLPPTQAGFGALAMKYSEDGATRYQGGDVGWLEKNSTDFRFGPAVAKAIMALNVAGELTPIVPTKEGLVLARLIEKQPASTRPLSEVKEGLAYRLTRAKAAQREAEFSASLKTGLNIVINRSLLESLTRPLPETKPPGLPGVAAAQANAGSEPAPLIQ